MLQLTSLYQIQAPFVKLKHAQLVLAHSTRSNKYVPPLANPISEQRVIGLAEDRNQTYQTSRNEFLESAQEALILKDVKSFRRPWDDVEHPLPFWDLSEQELEALTSSQLEVLATPKVSLTPVPQRMKLMINQPVSQSMIPSWLWHSAHQQILYHSTGMSSL